MPVLEIDATHYAARVKPEDCAELVSINHLLVINSLADNSFKVLTFF